eukprot:SAG11_NODE_2423_length_3379_cov_7.970732_3_plen_106_part_00
MGQLDADDIGACRHELKAAAPNASFGMISQSIGTMWKEMSDTERKVYSERAADMVRQQGNARLVFCCNMCVLQGENMVRNSAGGINGACAWRIFSSCFVRCYEAL